MASPLTALLSRWPLAPTPSLLTQSTSISKRLAPLAPNSPFVSSRRSAIVALSTSGDVDTFTENSGYLFELSDSEAESIVEYDIRRIASIYQKKPLIVIRRLFQIGSNFGKWFLLRYIDGLMERSDAMFKIRASELRKILVEFGPAYVKIAQAVSSRADLIPPSYLEELSVLQDRITPFSNEVAFSTIEAELGLSIDELFSEISSKPVAAASLGQVYRARLRSTGQVVAIKVQRPGVRAAIALDILILRFMAGIIRRAGKFNTDLQAVIDEWASSLFREMDYRKEAENGLKFRELYGNLQDVMVPFMYMDVTTQKVLVMEWVEGKKLSEVKDLYLVEIGVYCSFNQLLEYGFYHADPHPGNLLRTYDGKLAYLDFGMMGEFKEELRDGFIEACLHLVNRDFDALARDFVTLGLLPPTSDKAAVTQALTGIFQNAVSKGVSNISFGDLSANLGVTMYKFKFRIPSYFSLVIRSLAVLEGIAISFDPNYKVLGSTYPWIAKKVLTDSSPKLKSSLQDLLYKDGIFRIDRLESLLTESLRARTDKAAAASESKLISKEIISFTLTDKGAFVREILLDEISKGLDAMGISVTSSAVANLPLPAPFPLFTLTEEDVINLRNLQRLFTLVSGFQKNSSKRDQQVSQYMNQTQLPKELSEAIDQLPLAQEVLPFYSAVSELSLEEQQRLYRLPADLASRLLSRIAARTLRTLLL
ncbi:hypothetical protein V2J09_017361 [Rumex salicifolius]